MPWVVQNGSPIFYPDAFEGTEHPPASGLPSDFGDTRTRLRVLTELADSIDRVQNQVFKVAAVVPTIAAATAGSALSGTLYLPSDAGFPNLYNKRYTFCCGPWARRGPTFPNDAVWAPANSTLTTGPLYTGDGASNPGSGIISNGGERVRWRSSSPDFEIYFRATQANNGYRLKCNGEYVKTGAFGHNLSVGSFYFIRFTWGAGGAGDRLMRNYELEIGNGMECGFGGIKCDELDAPIAWAPEGGLSIAVHGDSMFAAVSDTGGSGGLLLPIMAGNLMSMMVGQSEVWNLGVGAVGFITKSGGNNNFVELAPYNIHARNFDVIFDYGGRNDIPSSAAEEQAAVQAWAEGILTDKPDTIIFMSGPILSNTATASQQRYLDVRTAKQNVAALFPKNCAFIDTMEANALWVHGTGKQGTTTGDGNADVVIGPDGVHATFFGGEYLARRYVSGVRSSINTLIAAQEL